MKRTNYYDPDQEIYNHPERNNHFNQDVLNDVAADVMFMYNSQVASGIQSTVNKWRQYTFTDPKVAGNDPDAYWQGADYDGSELSGGSAQTPDQNQVDENAQPWGIYYSPYEEIDLNKKIKRLELDRLENEGRDL